MKEEQTNRKTRREFFRSFVRWTLLGGLGVLSIRLARGKPRIDGNRHHCTNLGICGECAELRSCLLPRAVSARSVLGKQRNRNLS